MWHSRARRLELMFLIPTLSSVLPRLEPAHDGMHNLRFPPVWPSPGSLKGGGVGFCLSSDNTGVAYKGQKGWRIESMECRGDL